VAGATISAGKGVGIVGSTGPMASDWYYSRIGAPVGHREGPFSWEQLYAQAQSGAFGRDDLVWNPGLADWTPAAQITGLFPAPTALVTPPMVAQPPTPVAQPPMYPVSAPAQKRSWLLPILIPVVAVIVVGAALGAYFGVWYGKGDGGTVVTAPDGSSTSTSEGDASDMGNAEIVDADPAMVVESGTYGPAPANQVLVLMAEGKTRSDAEAVAEQIGGTVVGEMEYIGLYQIQTSGSTAQDLETAIATAGAISGVDSAFPNGLTETKGPIEGKKCSPMRDPLYDSGDNAAAYDMIGTQEAWDILKASGVKLSDTHVGIVDSDVYTKSGQDFGTELNFPDADGNYPAGKAKVRGLEAKDTTDQPEAGGHGGGLTHGTQVAHIIGADPGNGASGVAGVLQDKLTMTFSNATNTGGDWTWQAANPNPLDVTQYQGFYVRSLVEMQKQVQAGAKVINLSIGPNKPEATNAWSAAAYKRFFEQMAKDKPDVLFVAAAGNENGALDGSNYGPGGFKLPNVITVGALDHSGDRANAGDWFDPAVIQQAYDDRMAAGSIPANWTVDDFIKNVGSGSNYATGNGEVTLSACGSGVPTGVDPDGKPVLSSGTSFATPQVVAAAALLKSINPKLTAQQIKDILVQTAASEVDRDGTKVAVPADVGGKVLRVDDAVLKVINDLRGPGNELSKQDLLDLASVKLVADGGPTDYTVTAAIAKANPGGADLTITVMGEGVVTGSTSQHLAGPGEVSWTVSPKEGTTPTIRVVRSDTGGCAILVLETIDINGHWEGTMTFVEMNLDPAATSSDSEEGCGIELIGEIFAKLQGRPLPMTMDITVDEAGNGTAVMLIDASSIAAEIAAENPDVEVSSTPEPNTLYFTYSGDTLDFTLDESSGASGSMTGKVGKEGDALVINGTLAGAETGFSIVANWSVTKQ